jgi:hypothetical protein
MKYIIVTLFLFSIIKNVFAQNIIPVYDRNTKTYYYIDTVTKNIISRDKYDQADLFAEGMARVNRNGLWGYINESGEEVIRCKYIHANAFSEGLAAVSIGTLKIHENFVNVEDEMYGIIDKYGSIKIGFIFKEIYPFKRGLAKANHGQLNQWGVINTKGEWKIKPKYSWISDFDERGIAKVTISGKSGYIDIEDNVLIKPDFLYLGDYKEDLIIAGNDFNKKGFIDKNGATRISFVYQDVNEFIDGISRVKINGKWGYIDQTGQMTITNQYNYISDFNRGIALANKNNLWGMIDKSEKTKLPFIYDFIIEDRSKERILISKNGLWGMYDYWGNEIIPIKYEVISIKDPNTFYAIKGNRQASYDKNGRLISEASNKNWHDLSTKNIKDHWDLCSWIENDEGKILHQYPVTGGYKFDTIYYGSNPELIIVRKNNYFGITSHDGIFSSEVIYDSIKSINPLENNYNDYYQLACYRNNTIDYVELKRPTQSKNNQYKKSYTDYDVMHNYSNASNYIRVGKNKKFGLVRISNNEFSEIVPLIFEDIGPVFRDSFIFVKKDNLWGVWNIKLNSLHINYQYPKVKLVNGIAVSNNNKWALLNNELKQVTPFIFDKIRELPCMGDFNYVLINNKWGIINDDDGVLLYNPIFDRIKVSPNHGNGYVGIYTIGKCTFKLYFYGMQINPGFFLSEYNY